MAGSEESVLSASLNRIIKAIFSRWWKRGNNVEPADSYVVTPVAVSTTESSHALNAKCRRCHLLASATDVSLIETGDAAASGMAIPVSPWPLEFQGGTTLYFRKGTGSGTVWVLEEILDTIGTELGA